mgnify:CR=1 FL=1
MSLGIWFKSVPCAHCGRSDGTVWERSPTYNLAEMWNAAGVPFEPGIEGQTAGSLLPRLESSLLELKSNPAKYRAMNAPNGWGTYEDLVSVLESAIEAARAYPDAIVGTWR